MAYLVDTNVVLRVLDCVDNLHAQSINSINVLKARGEDLVISAQIVAEFWSVSTRSPAANPPGIYGLSTAEAEQRLNRVELIFAVLPDPPEVYRVWRSLVIRNFVVGMQVHDACHAAWALAYGIENILTFNGKDFARFKDITAVNPRDVV